MKAKLKSIRTVYTRERQKVNTKKIGTRLDEVYISKFVHYNQLQFLNDFIALANGSILKKNPKRWSPCQHQPNLKASEKCSLFVTMLDESSL